MSLVADQVRMSSQPKSLRLYSRYGLNARMLQCCLISLHNRTLIRPFKYLGEYVIPGLLNSRIPVIAAGMDETRPEKNKNRTLGPYGF